MKLINKRGLAATAGITMALILASGCGSIDKKGIDSQKVKDEVSTFLEGIDKLSDAGEEDADSSANTHDEADSVWLTSNASDEETDSTEELSGETNTETDTQAALSDTTNTETDTQAALTDTTDTETNTSAALSDTTNTGADPSASSSDTETDEEEEDSGILSSVEDIALHAIDSTGEKYEFTYDSETYSAVYTTDNWRIINSYKINNEDDMTIICQALLDIHPIHGSDMESYRTADDMAYEWTQHNLAYRFLKDGDSFKEKAKDVDFDPEDQNKSFDEIYEDRTGREFDIKDMLKRLSDG